MILLWEKVTLSGDYVLIPGSHRRSYVETLARQLANSLDVADLLNVAQYDFKGGLKPPKEAYKSLKRVSKALQIDRRSLERETSSTYLFATLIYYLLRSDNSYRGLAFIVEPRIESSVPGGVPLQLSFDYAIIDPLNPYRVFSLIEVKRMMTLSNIKEYLKDFITKFKSLPITPEKRKVVLHLHASPPLCTDRGIMDLLEGASLLLNASGGVLSLVTTHGCKNVEGIFKNREPNKRNT